MKTRSIILAVAIISLLLVSRSHATGENGIIVRNADSTLELPVIVSQNLSDTAAGVGTHFTIQYANSIRVYQLVSVPAPLQNLFGQVADRISFQYANSNQLYDLAAVPAAFQTLLEQTASRIIFQYANSNRLYNLVTIPGLFQTLLSEVSDRVVIQYANSNQAYSLSYPVVLIKDNTPPQITNSISATQITDTSYKISWTTDEYANSTVLFGTAPGIYPHAVSDLLYVEQHEVTLAGLEPATVYYYQVYNSDRTGNTSVVDGPAPLGSCNIQPYDVVADGRIDIRDIQYLASHWPNTPASQIAVAARLWRHICP
ncbi:MAG: hypothetical protein EXR62_18545 [Chloroflexi bacterium]|nr:hypothetical protein [Chloroflexota bacterium]